MITIIDYGAGNIGSIQNMIKRTGGDCVISNCPNEIANAKKIILPGVGSFNHGMQNLRKYNLIEVLKKKVLECNTPILGICLGMQLMTLGSEEGDEQGLGFINAKVKKFKTQNNKLKIPHMGWNKITLRKSSKLFDDLFIEKFQQKFYFVHSYYVQCTNSIDVLATTNYIHEFTSAFENNNIIGMQYHPEKSHKFGMEVFKNFIRI